MINKQIIKSKCDALLLVTARQLLQMEDLIFDLKKTGINLQILTYNMTLDYKNKIDKFVDGYFEKEKLIDSKVRREAADLYKKLVAKHDWTRFTHPKYNNNKTVSKFLRDKLKKIAYEEMGEVLIDITLAEKMLPALDPKILITTTDPDTKVLPYIKLAKGLGKTTVCLQHGAFYAFDSPAIYPQSDHFITWSNLTKNWLVKNNHFRRLSIFIGQSPFHKLAKFKSLKPKKGGIKILYLTSVHLVDQGIVNYYLKKLFRLLEEKKQKIILLVRTHPNQVQHIVNLRALIAHSSLDADLVNDGDLDKLIKQSDLVIYENTTAGFDTMLAGKPTVYFNPYSGEDFFSVRSNDASLAILNEKDLDNLLIPFLDNVKLWSRFAKNGFSYAKKYLGVDRQTKISKISKVLVRLLKTRT